MYVFILFYELKNGISNYYITDFNLVKSYSKLNIAESLVLIGNEHLYNDEQHIMILLSY